MPTYIYECEGCGGTLERRQSFSDAPLTTHEECGGKLRRVVHAAPVIFKGSGFYSTDNRSSSRHNGDSAKDSDKSESKSESKNGSVSESKSESKSDAKSDSKGSASSSEKGSASTSSSSPTSE